jgi:hypothetical protein
MADERDPIAKVNKIVAALKADYPKLERVSSEQLFGAVMDVLTHNDDRELQLIGKTYGQPLTAAQVLKRK